jgi:hypothetical protein
MEHRGGMGRSEDRRRMRERDATSALPCSPNASGMDGQEVTGGCSMGKGSALKPTSVDVGGPIVATIWQLGERHSSMRAAWGLLGADALLLLAGVLWWAWDADPAWGAALVAAGIVVGVGGVALARGRMAVPVRVLTGIAVLLSIFGAVEIWLAISTILSQAAAHTA